MTKCSRRNRLRGARLGGAAACICLALAVGATSAAAQRGDPPAPWTVTLTPTMNPLPAGFCAAVRLTVMDGSGKDVPRNAAGYRVTIADFDLAVTAADPKAVVGIFAGRSNWSVCACQSAPVGTVATITASYPGRALAEESRVRGVNAEASTAFTTAAAKGTTEPAGCQSTAAPVVAEALPSIPQPLPRDPGRTPAPPTPRVPIGPPAPTGFRLASSVPLIATLVWDSMPNAVAYAVSRTGTGVPAVQRPNVPQASAKSARDTIPDPRITFSYTLRVQYADGTSAQSPAVEFTSPPLANPTAFNARDRGLGNVDFQWKPVAGAVRYRLDGPGIPGTGFFTKDTSTSYPKIPGGANAWKLTALYQGNFADYINPAIATAVVRVLPPHTVPWLSKNNGVGSSATVQRPKDISIVECGKMPYGQMDSVYDNSKRWLGKLGIKVRPCFDNPDQSKVGLQVWAGLDVPLWGDATVYGYEAVYGNAVDLGVGRRTNCSQGPSPWPGFGLVTICYATAHGIPPGQAGFNDSSKITRPEPGIGDDFILAMVIVKDTSGTVFLVLLRDSAIVDGKAVPRYGRLAERVALDGEGPKYLPQVCVSCHGGKYNATTRKVDGASFLPLDPSLLAFSSPAEQAAQEENIRTMNTIIVASEPTSAVAAYIRGLYGNKFSVPGTRATPSYVPQGWSSQAGFYKSVVKPYCAMCHLAAPTSWNFATWQNFQDNSALIRVAVCNAHTMPHSELQYKAFWTKDTGPVYTPGLLATTLGLASCP
ncbi:MAG: hypothetical protein ABJD07_13655 [Gemmatimonadaceae bacterium]